MAMIKCPECGKEIVDTLKICPNCGFPFEEKIYNVTTIDELDVDMLISEIKNECEQKQNSNALNVIDNKTKVMIVVSIVLLIFAVSIILKDEFMYYIQNISYYTEQYQETIAKSGGFLGAQYHALAMKWKDLRTEAIFYVITRSIASISLFVIGGVGLRKSIKKIKINKDNL